MDNANSLPNDLGECQQLLLVAFKQSAELERVLEPTAASHQELKEKHQAMLDELNALKRWIYGRRRERIVEGEGQQHLFDLQPPATDEPEEPIQEEPQQQVAAHSWPTPTISGRHCAATRKTGGCPSTTT